MSGDKQDPWIDREPLGLGELIDLEAELRLDRKRDPTGVRTRDRMIRGGLPEALRNLSGDAPGAANRLLRAWLAAVYSGRPRPGSAMRRGLGMLRLMLAAAGLTVGAATGATLLHYDGERPVLVSVFLGLAVVPQVVLLSVMMVRAVAGTVGLRNTANATWSRRLADLLLILCVRERPSRDFLAGFLAGGGQGGAAGFDTGLGRVLSGHAFIGLQIFGVGFNLGLLGVMLGLVMLTDLAFVWSTTLAIGADKVADMLQWIALPWAGIWPAAVPGLDLVGSTHFFRLGSSGLRRLDPALAGAWWPFLTATVITYGLLPRVVALAAGGIQTRRATGGALKGAGEVGELVARLRGERAEEQADSAPAPELPALVAPVAVVRWRGAAVGESACRALLAGHGVDGAAIAFLGGAGGQDGDLDGVLVAERIRAEAPAASLLLLVDHFENFDKALRRVLRGLRERLGPHARMTLGLAVPSSTPDASLALKTRIWRRAVSDHADPGLNLLILRTPEGGGA